MVFLIHEDGAIKLVDIRGTSSYNDCGNKPLSMTRDVIFYLKIFNNPVITRL
jgi:hypothetical protein